MAWTDGLGFNFRETAVYVTDGARDQSVVYTNQVYPQTTHNSGETVTYGFPNAPTEGNGVSLRNRSAAVDARLAGTLSVDNASATDTYTFRVDLPSAGTYSVRLAFGAAAGTTSRNYWRILDDATQLALIDDSGTERSAGQFLDSEGTLHTSAANWVSNNVAVNYGFSSTILRVEMGVPGAGTANATRIVHLSIAQVATGPSISSVTPATFINGQTGIVIAGTGFGATQGAGQVRIGTSSSNPATGAVAQTVTSWGDTSITITAVRGALAHNTNHYLFVTDNGGTSNATGSVVQFTTGIITLRWRT